ncbi:MAG TPA: DUF1800 domain-containing protein [Steroidobacteraceae bacterium]|jgi:uncharacterized protein (DUF1800 family)|nr:DUF1800 domain-containing protein [Steroidobacteraceae bacterium]
MMQAEIAVLRFGLGARPGELAAAAAEPRAWLMAQIRGPAPSAANASLAPSDQIFAGLLAARDERQMLQRESAAQGSEAKMAFNAIREAYQPHYRAQVLARAQSAALTMRPFAERLVHFWANHFAVSADKGVVYGLAGTLENEAIRPHVGGRFVGLLTAVEQHPAMIAFLDNQYSVGTDSVAAQFAARFRGRNATTPNRRFGINENLAREILELHTLGVNGGYTQADVTSFAQIITGWSIGGGKGRLAGGAPGRFYFRENLHQPGAKVFLGKTYSQAGRQQGEAVLADLAQRPQTAKFIATKLVRHFIADDPPPAAVERVARSFLKSGGDLPQVYAALIDSPESWEAKARKFKTPEDFVFSTLRALNVAPAQPEELIRTFDLLGQRQFTPGSPAGWPDTSKNWDGSDALMHRVLWASRVGAKYERGVEPAQLAAESLGGYARAETLSALRRASSGSQAVALLLMSPEFQRR